MKKYIIPSIITVHVEVQQPLAESLGIKEGSIDDESQVLSRENNSEWGDENDN